MIKCKNCRDGGNTCTPYVYNYIISIFLNKRTNKILRYKILLASVMYIASTDLLKYEKNPESGG